MPLSIYFNKKIAEILYGILCTKKVKTIEIYETKGQYNAFLLGNNSFFLLNHLNLLKLNTISSIGDRMKKTQLALFLIFSISLFALNAQDKSIITVDDAVSKALENNITIKQNQIKLDSSKRTYDHIWSAITPSVSVGAGLQKTNKDFDENYTAYIQGSVSLSLSPALYSGIKIAKLNYEAGQISYETAVRTIELNVRTAFYGLLYQEEYIALQRNSLEMAQKQYEQNLARYNQGAISQLDVLSSQVTYESKKPTLESAIVSRDNSLASFKQSLGIPQDQEIELTGSLDDFLNIKNITIDDLTDDVPEIKAMEKSLETAKATLLNTRLTKWGPTISAGWTYHPYVTNLKPDEPTDSGALSLSVTIPLDTWLPWSTGADAIATSKDTVKDLELQLENAKTTVAVNTESSLRAITQSLATIESLKANITLAQQTYDMTLQAYNRGSRDLLTLQDSENSLRQAQVNLKSELYNLISTVLKLENSLGVPFGTLLK